MSFLPRKFIGGLYVGLWVMFIGGIIQTIEAAKMTPVDSAGIAYGAVRFLFASIVGGLTFWLGFFSGGFFLNAAGVGRKPTLSRRFR